MTPSNNNTNTTIPLLTPDQLQIFVRKRKFNFSQCASEINTSLFERRFQFKTVTSDRVRLSFARKEELSALPLETTTGVGDASSETVPSLKSTSSKTTTIEEHNERRKRVFQKAFDSLSFVSKDNYSNGTFCEVVAALQLQNQEEEDEKRKKRERDDEAQLVAILSKQRERLRNRFRDDSEDNQGINPLQQRDDEDFFVTSTTTGTSRSSSPLKSHCVLMTADIGKAIDAILDDIDEIKTDELSYDSNDDVVEEGTFDWVMKYLDSNQPSASGIPVSSPFDNTVAMRSSSKHYHQSSPISPKEESTTKYVRAPVVLHSIPHHSNGDSHMIVSQGSPKTSEVRQRVATTSLPSNSKATSEGKGTDVKFCYERRRGHCHEKLDLRNKDLSLREEKQDDQDNDDDDDLEWLNARRQMKYSWKQAS